VPVLVNWKKSPAALFRNRGFVAGAKATSLATPLSNAPRLIPPKGPALPDASVAKATSFATPLSSAPRLIPPKGPQAAFG
jgi:hypothetical protein